MSRLSDVEVKFIDAIKKHAKSRALTEDQTELLISIARDAILSGRKPTSPEWTNKLERLGKED